MEYSRLYIGNLNEDIKQDDILREFERFITLFVVISSFILNSVSLLFFLKVR